MLTTSSRESPRGVSKPLTELDAGRLQLLQSAALAVADRLWSDGKIHLQKLKEVMVCWAQDVTIVWENGFRLILNDVMGEGLLSNPGCFFAATVSHNISKIYDTADYDKDSWGIVYFWEYLQNTSVFQLCLCFITQMLCYKAWNLDKMNKLSIFIFLALWHWVFYSICSGLVCLYITMHKFTYDKKYS